MLTALIACSDGGAAADGGADSAGRTVDGAAGSTTANASGGASSIASSSAAGALPDAANQQSIVFLGTSLTAGLGVGHDVAYPAIIEQRIAEAKLPYRVTNAGISGETSAGGLRRIDWLLQTPVDVLVLELGANDGLRALSVEAMKTNLEAILQRTRAKYPTAAIVILGMEAPPNLGKPYTSQFHDVYPELARKYDAQLVPFLLQGVAGVRGMNQEDGVHPNPDGHRVLADNVWSVLQPVLVKRAQAPS